MREKPSSLKGLKWLIYDVKVKFAGKRKNDKKKKIYNKKLGHLCLTSLEHIYANVKIKRATKPYSNIIPIFHSHL